jgi:hypothetical protein
MGVAPSKIANRVGRGSCRLPGRSAQNKTIGGRKGYFSGRFGLPIFQAHRYMSLYGAPKELKKQKTGTG